MHTANYRASIFAIVNPPSLRRRASGVARRRFIG